MKLHYQIQIKETARFRPSDCDRKLTYSECMQLGGEVDFIIELQLYLLATKGHLFLDRIFLEERLRMETAKTVEESVGELIMFMKTKAAIDYYVKPMEAEARNLIRCFSVKRMLR